MMFYVKIKTKGYHLKPKKIMKVKLLLMVAIVGFTFASCDSFKELASVDVETEVKVDVPLQDAAASLKSASLAGNMIEGSADISLKDNNDVKEFVDGIIGMTITDAIANVTGMTDADEITDLVIKATINGTVYELLNEDGPITTSSTDIKLVKSEADALIDELKEQGYDQTIKFDVTGTSKELVGSRLKLKIEMPADVKYSPL